MRKRRVSKSQEKRIAVQKANVPDKPCACDVHLKMDATRKDAIPCIGHGVGCPCTELKMSPPPGSTLEIQTGEDLKIE
jgi:hypothetical protein